MCKTKRLHFSDCQKCFSSIIRLEKLVVSESQKLEIFTSDREAHAVKSDSLSMLSLWKQKVILGFCKYVSHTYLQHMCACLRCGLQPRVELLRTPGYRGMELAITSFTQHSFLQDSCRPGSWRATTAYKPVDPLDFCCRTLHQSEVWSGNLSGGKSSVGGHPQDRWNYPDKSVFLMVGLLTLQGTEM